MSVLACAFLLYDRRAGTSPEQASVSRPPSESLELAAPPAGAALPRGVLQPSIATMAMASHPRVRCLTVLNFFIA